MQRNLVFNYLCHNCYLKTAQAFAKDSAIGHLDKDEDDRDQTTARGVGVIGSQGSSVALSDELVRNILLRQRTSSETWSQPIIPVYQFTHVSYKGIHSEILSGNIQEAIGLLNRHFPKVLAENGGEDEMEVTDENANPSQFAYFADTVNPTHLSLNLRILAFIEACRTIPLVYTPPRPSAESPISPDSDVAMAGMSPTERDPKDEENHQSELLICVQNLYATVNALQKTEDRNVYLKELSNVGGLLAYKVPENSPMAKYLHQERRDRVAEQINSAILRGSCCTLSVLF